MRSSLLLFSVSFIFVILLMSCSVFGKSVEVGEEFKLSPNESVSIKNRDLTLTLKEVGREWVVSPNGAGGSERPYVLTELTFSGKTIRSNLEFNKPIQAGSCLVRLVKVEPFSKASATFKVECD